MSLCLLVILDEILPSYGNVSVYTGYINSVYIDLAVIKAERLIKKPID